MVKSRRTSRASRRAMKRKHSKRHARRSSHRRRHIRKQHGGTAIQGIYTVWMNINGNGNIAGAWATSPLVINDELTTPVTNVIQINGLPAAKLAAVRAYAWTTKLNVTPPVYEWRQVPNANLSSSKINITTTGNSSYLGRGLTMTAATGASASGNFGLVLPATVPTVAPAAPVGTAFTANQSIKISGISLANIGSISLGQLDSSVAQQTGGKGVTSNGFNFKIELILCPSASTTATDTNGTVTCMP